MNKQEIIHELKTHHDNFTNYIGLLKDEDFLFALNKEKWTAGQQLDHIFRAVKPLADGMVLPKFAVGILFGKSKRNSKTYEELVAKYHAILNNGGKASGSFIPKGINFSERDNLKNKLNGKLNKLCKQLNKYSETELDKYIIPHPLLGKLTLREMMYFTIYHVQHHHKTTADNLARKA